MNAAFTTNNFGNYFQALSLYQIKSGAQRGTWAIDVIWPGPNKVKMMLPVGLRAPSLTATQKWQETGLLQRQNLLCLMIRDMPPNERFLSHSCFFVLDDDQLIIGLSVIVSPGLTLTTKSGALNIKTVKVIGQMQFFLQRELFAFLKICLKVAHCNLVACTIR